MAFVLGECLTVFEIRFIWIVAFMALLIAFTIITGKLCFMKPLIIIVSFVMAGNILMVDTQGSLLPGEPAITASEVVIEGKAGELTTKNGRTYIFIKNACIRTDGFNDQYKKVLVYFNDEIGVKPGNIVKIQAVHKEFLKARNPGNFDEETYYHSLGVACKFYGKTLYISDGRYNVAADRLFKVKALLKDVVYSISSEKQASIFCAILLGETSALDEETKSLYQDSGISHILAISGLHISIIGLGIYKLLRKKLYPTPATVISVIFIISYGVMTGGAVSILRAVIMFIMKLAADLLGRTFDIATAIAAAALLLLLENSFYLFNIGFLLSFTAVLAIAVFFPIAQKFFMIQNWLIQTFCISIIISILTMPVILYVNSEIPTYSALINLIVIPMSNVALISGLAASVTGIFFVKLGRFLIGIGCYILQFIEFVCRVFLSLPYSAITAGRQSLLRNVLYYMLVIVFTLFMHRLNKQALDRNFWKTRYVVRGICILFTSLMGLTLFFHPQENLEITMIDVGQGEAIFIKTPDKRTILIDGGSTDITEVAKYRMIPFIKSEGINQIDYLFITHVDDDHVGGIFELFNHYEEYAFTIETVFLAENIIIDDAYEDFVESAKKCGVKIRHINSKTLLVDHGVKIKCLHPDAVFSGTDRNAFSMVLSLQYKDFTILFTGDIEEQGENSLLRQNLLSDCDILKIAHHGSKTSTTKEFLEAVNPENAIISCGVNNRYGHPHPDTLTKLEELNIAYYMTSESGAIQISSDGLSYRIKSFLN